MCLREANIINPTKYLSRNYNQVYRQKIGCCDCAECRGQRQKEWHVRAYWQAREYIDNDGWIYFDSLTYDNDHLPHLSDFDSRVKRFGEFDFSCFSYEDIRLFLVNLRRQLDYHGYNTKDNLKYFVSSEYGSDKSYLSSTGLLRKATMRPHYHILFFVKGESKLKPSELSYFVDKCWQKGRTDGYMYHPEDSNYIYKHTYGKLFVNEDLAVRRVVSYVSKYVLKDQQFNGKVMSRLNKLYNYLYDEDWTKYSKHSKDFEVLYRKVNMFHRQSQGFGLYLLENEDPEHLYDGYVILPDDDKVKKKYKLPTYYLHHLWYEKYRNDKGKLDYRLTEEGIEWKFDRIDKTIDMIANRMEEWMKNIVGSTFLTTDDVFNGQTGEYDLHYSAKECYDKSLELYDKVVKLLDGRSWHDYAEYLICYRGRIRSELACRTGLKDDIYVVKNNIVFGNKEEYAKDIWLYNYASRSDRLNYRKNFVSSINMGNKDDGYRKHYLVDFGYEEDTNSFCGKKDIDETVFSLGGICMSPEMFERMYCYNENSDPEFHDFDKIADCYRIGNIYISRRKQKAYDTKNDLKKKFKDLGYYVRNI